MTDTLVPQLARRGLEQRLAAVAGELLDPVAEVDHEAMDAFTLLEVIVAALHQRPHVHRTWLLLTALTAGFPRGELVRDAHRRIGHRTPTEATIWLLRASANEMAATDAVAEIELVTDRPVVDVNFSARYDWLSGIQRVVRNLVPRWAVHHRLSVVRWCEGASMFCDLSPEEAARVGTGPESAAGQPERRLVPWGVPVLLPEVTSQRPSARLSALARYSPNPVRLIGYDCIPAVSGELVTDTEREKFADYLEIVKYVDLVAAISATAETEFQGFRGALRAQGLDGPEVVRCALPTAVRLPSGPERSSQTTSVPDVPEVVCVGVLDERKNQIGVVEAAEHLWREGLEFRLLLVGGVGRRVEDLMVLVRRLQAAGRPLSVVEGPVSDSVVDSAYRSARVVALPSLHEGYGLPLVEALSYGVPVITSNFGSLREVGEGHGAALVDPANIEEIVSCLRRLLTDDAAHAELVEQARARPTRTWDDYARELWEVLVP